MRLLPPAKYELIESWVFFGESPMPMIAIFAVYFICLKIGPILMKNRQPFKLKGTIRLYNIVQIIGCVYFSYIGHVRFKYNYFKSTWKCETNDMYLSTPEDIIEIFNINWLFFWLRLIELLETIFFIMRKKQDQVSFLHVYHHVSTLICLYIANRYSAEVMDMYIAILNNDVHILMYFYYFLSSFRRLQRKLSKLKPLMTTIQIVQLSLILGQCFAVKLCGISTGIFYIAVVNVTVLLTSFSNFYYQSYMKKRAVMENEKNAKKE